MGITDASGRLVYNDVITGAAFCKVLPRKPTEFASSFC